MKQQEIQKYIANDWLSRHWEEFVEVSEKITKTIIISRAVELRWSKPMKTFEDYEAFIEAEAESKNLTADEARRYLLDAGRLKARNLIFEKYCVPLLPKNEEGKCAASREELLRFINRSTKGKAPSKGYR